MKRTFFTTRSFFIVSAVVHVVFMLAISVVPSQRPHPQTTRVEFEVSHATLPVPTQTEAQPKKRVTPLKTQIVDQDERPLNDETPEEARFLSRKNQVVKKQTVSTNHGDFANKAASEEPKGNSGQGKDLAALDLKPSFDISKTVEQQIQKEQAFEKSVQEGFVPTKAKTADNKSNPGAMGSSGAEASKTLDYIKDLDPGLETLLSTKEFVYYTYFNRIRSQLNQYWSAKVRLKISEMYRKGRSLASTDDKITKCLVTLDKGGRLIRIQIIGDSGVRELDEAAVESFNSAAPFPNPPSGMVDTDGTIKIRWDFILEA